MSSKTKTIATTEEARPALVPKLRFPEFRGTEGWKEKRLGNEGEFLSSLTGKAGGDFDVGEARFVTYMNVFSNTFVDPKALRLVDVKEGENQNAVASGDVFFTISSETPEEVGMSSVLLEDLENCYLNSFCALFRFSKSKRPNPVFTGYLLRQPLVRDYFTKKAQGSTRFNLSKDAFRSLPFFVPSPAEQQKIAECLSSVDELMAAQAQKVDALTTHKKGLMQQLFPREGETQPRLRFPEFQKAGAWKPRKAGTLFANRVTKGEQGLPIYSVTMHDGMVKRDSFDRNFYDIEDAAGNKKVCKEDIAYNMMRMWQGALGVAPEDCLVSPAYIVLAPMKGAVPVFFQYLFKLPATLLLLTSHSRGLTKDRLRLYYDDFASIPLRCPAPPEQQRIASCLTSLDALITAETQKLEALKTHKKGLMQQLFPSPEEVEA